MKTAQESIARTFYQDFTKAAAEYAHEANDKKEFDGFSTNNIKDGWIDYRGLSLGFALLEDPYRITCTVGPDGPFVGYQQVFSIQSENDQVKAVLEGDGSVFFDSPKELAKYALNELARRRHESNAV